MKPKKRNERSFTASTLGKWTTLTVVLVVLLGTASFGFGQGSSLSTWDKGAQVSVAHYRQNCPQYWLGLKIDLRTNA